MKKVQKLFILSIFCMFWVSDVLAACTSVDADQYRNEAVQIKPSYEKKTRTLNDNEYDMPDGTPDDDEIDITVDYFTVHISNLTENLYIKVFNKTTEETKTYNYSESINGTVTFDWHNINKIADLVITVYTSSSTGCPDTKLYETSLQIPRYNYYSLENICENASEYYLCREYVTVNEVDYPTFINSVQKYLDGKVDNNGEENEERNKEEKKENNNVIVILGISVAVIAVGVGAVIIVKRQRRKKNEKKKRR